jgi:hypothetical protein
LSINHDWRLRRGVGKERATQDMGKGKQRDGKLPISCHLESMMFIFYVDPFLFIPAVALTPEPY